MDCPLPIATPSPPMGSGCYALNVNRWTTLTFDYQFIANPAISLFAARLHAEF